MLHGDGGNDRLEGGAGADVLDGGTGLDRATYRDAQAAITIDLTNPAANSGDAAGDSFVSVEEFQLTAYADSFVGSNAADVVFTGGGDDVICGGDGDDTITASSTFHHSGFRDNFRVMAGMTFSHPASARIRCQAVLEMTC